MPSLSKYAEQVVVEMKDCKRFLKLELETVICLLVNEGLASNSESLFWKCVDSE
jgi:hypothetical protein